MQGLLIADGDIDSRKRMAQLFIDAGYNVVVSNTAAVALYGILKKTVQVVLLSAVFDEFSASELIPLLKRCNRNLCIILISSNESIALLRKARREGIFYHALKPLAHEDGDEIRQVVRCAFAQLPESHGMLRNGQ